MRRDRESEIRRLGLEPEDELWLRVALERDRMPGWVRSLLTAALLIGVFYVLVFLGLYLTS